MGAALSSIVAWSANAVPVHAIDLTNNADYSLKTVLGIYGYGGNGLVGNFQTQPAGTGVFDPFLSINSQGNNPIESGYNTNGAPLYLDQQGPTRNTLLKLSDLATVAVNGANYYAFELDANEPGNAKGLISIDNVRIYTSPTDTTTTVKSDETQLNNLGSLRWAMNDPLSACGTAFDPYNVKQWIDLDANQSKGNGGSGISDMILYVPTAAFVSAGANDFVWFYNLNGVHYAADSNLAAQAGFEEWRAVTSTDPQRQVPDGGSTLLLLTLTCGGLGYMARHGSATVKSA